MITVTRETVAQLEDGATYAVRMRGLPGIYSHVSAERARTMLATSPHAARIILERTA